MVTIAILAFLGIIALVTIKCVSVDGDLQILITMVVILQMPVLHVRLDKAQRHPKLLPVICAIQEHIRLMRVT